MIWALRIVLFVYVHKDSSEFLCMFRFFIDSHFFEKRSESKMNILGLGTTNTPVDVSFQAWPVCLRDFRLGYCGRLACGAWRDQISTATA